MYETSPEARIRIEAIARRLREIDLSSERLTPEAVHAGVVRDIYAELWDLKPFNTFLPERHGGSGAPAGEVLALLEAIAYEHLPMALAIGLTAALFLFPVSTHADDPIASEALGRFAGDEVVLGGMMMTEPGCGTDLFAAETRVEPRGENVRIRGTKHWQGLTGYADYWLIFGRNEEERRSRSLGFHIAPTHSGFEVEEFYRAHGLQPIPYGKTVFDVEVPAANRIGGNEPYTSVVGGILCGSRLSFSGVAHGFLRRMRRETERHVEKRTVFRQRLVDFDSVRARVEQVVYGECVTRALCLRVADASPRISSAKTPLFTEAAMVKALATDFMSEAANHLAVLRGGEGYRADQPGLEGVIHAHPFRVFEGPNDVLFEQFGRDRIKAAGTRDLTELLDRTGFRPAGKTLESLCSAHPEMESQREIATAGRVLGHAMAAGWAKEHAAGFEPAESALVDRLAEQTIATLYSGLLVNRELG